VILRYFERPKRPQIFPAVSQNTVEPLVTIHYNLAVRPCRYLDQIVAVSQNVFAVTKVKY